MNPSEIRRLSETTRQSVDIRITKRSFDRMITENHTESYIAVGSHESL